MILRVTINRNGSLLGDNSQWINVPPWSALNRISGKNVGMFYRLLIRRDSADHKRKVFSFSWNPSRNRFIGRAGRRDKKLEVVADGDFEGSKAGEVASTGGGKVTSLRKVP